MIGPFSVSMLLNAGFNILGGIGDRSAAKAQRRMEDLTTELNAVSQKNQIASEYNSLFEKQRQQLGVQKASLANMGIDKASSFYTQSLASHEKNFLKSTQDMKKDMENVTFQSDIRKRQSELDYLSRKSKAEVNAVMGAGKTGVNWASKKGYIDWFYQDKFTMPKVGGK